MTASGVSLATSPAEACRSALAHRLRAGTIKLPLLPKVAGQVLSMTSDPNADLGELSALIHRDQALAGHVLRIANSAAYAGSVPIVSLQQAVTRLGMQLLAEIALALSVQGETFHAANFQSEVKRLWRHSLASGTYGKEVARHKRQNVEGQFLCGLLHTLGKPVVLQSVTEWQKETGQTLDLEMARALVDEFHNEIGALIATTWKLPQQVLISCSFYSRYAEAPTFRLETAMTYLSDRLAEWIVSPEMVSEEALRTDPVLAVLNLYPDEVDTLLGRKDDVAKIVDAMNL